MTLAKFHEVVTVVGMTQKKQELLLNPHAVVGCRPSADGGSVVTLSTGTEVQVTESPEQINKILSAAR
jgi:hypothetical protein